MSAIKRGVQRYALSIASGILVAISLNALKQNQRTVLVASSLTTYYAILFSRKNDSNSEYLDINLESVDDNENIKIYTAAITKDPEIAGNYLRRGIANSNLGENNLALEDFNKAITLEPKNLAAISYRAACLGSLGDLQGCISGYTDILKIRPNDRNALSSVGNVAFGSSDFDLAIKCFDKILHSNKSDVEALGIRGACKLKLSDSKGALEDLDKALNDLPDDHKYSAYLYTTRGEAKADINEHLEAINDFSKAIELNPNWDEAYNGRGESKYALGSIKEAYDDFDKALNINPELSRAYFNRAIAKQELGLYEKAAIDWSKCIDTSNDFYFAYAKRAECNYSEKKYLDAIIDCDFLISNNQELERALNCRALCKEGLDRLDEAVSDFRAAYDVSKQLGYLYNAGLMYNKANLFADAILIFNEIIQINPNYSNAFLSRGYSQFYQENFSEALDDWKKASSMGNENASNWLETNEVKDLNLKYSPGYQKLEEWCIQQDVKEAEDLSLDVRFTITSITKAKEEMILAGWKEADVNNLPISAIFPIVSQFQTNILNMLGINGDELIKNRGLLLYDGIVMSELKLPADKVGESLNSWWSDYYNMTLKKMWNK